MASRPVREYRPLRLHELGVLEAEVRQVHLVSGLHREALPLLSVDEGVFDQAQAKVRARSKNYTQLELQILIKVWKVVSLDACTDTD